MNYDKFQFAFYTDDVANAIYIILYYISHICMYVHIIHTYVWAWVIASFIGPVAHSAYRIKLRSNLFYVPSPVAAGEGRVEGWGRSPGITPPFLGAPLEGFISPATGQLQVNKPAPRRSAGAEWNTTRHTCTRVYVCLPSRKLRCTRVC